MKTQSNITQAKIPGNNSGASTAPMIAAGTTHVEFKDLLADMEELIRNANALTAEELAHARAALSARIHAAKESAEEISNAVVERTRYAAQTADNYVHENPWQAVGIGAGVGAVVGLLVGIAIMRR